MSTLRFPAMWHFLAKQACMITCYPMHMCRSKIIGLSVRLFIGLLSPRKSPDLDIQAPEQLVSITNQSKSVTNWLECASNHQAWSTNVIHSALLSAIVANPSTVPTNQHAPAGQVLLQLMHTTGLVENVNITGLSLRRNLQMLSACRVYAGSFTKCFQTYVTVT